MEVEASLVLPFVSVEEFLVESTHEAFVLQVCLVFFVFVPKRREGIDNDSLHDVHHYDHHDDVEHVVIEEPPHVYVIGMLIRCHAHFIAGSGVHIRANATISFKAFVEQSQEAADSGGALSWR